MSQNYLSKKLFYVVLLITLLVVIILYNINRLSRPIFVSRYKDINKTDDTKYILLWTPNTWAPFNSFGEGQQQFIKNKCKVNNCFVTDDRNYLGDITIFHAIFFNGRILIKELPERRSSHQIYVYFNTESAVNSPLCDRIYDNYFNWTATYRLDSDILLSYICIKDINGTSVGPRKDMMWVDPVEECGDNFKRKLLNKTKAAAWFVSNCNSRSDRLSYAKKLKQALSEYGLTLDIYGECGEFRCPRENRDTCEKKLENDYFFYLSFENSFSEDYITEKVLTALQHDVVPIVYGGANYSIYLPPGSFLNARDHNPTELAGIIKHLIDNPSIYHGYFKWHNYYTFAAQTEIEFVCNVCETLNNKTMVESKHVYENLRTWWNPDYVNDCKRHH